MRVAVLFSGGKDSCWAVHRALQKGWSIDYLLSIKPSNKESYLYHFSTVELTPFQARAIGLRHHLIHASSADPGTEAKVAAAFVADHPVDALLVGGVGLQRTQIKALSEAVPAKVVCLDAGRNEFELLREIIETGYVFMISQIASEGMAGWLGKVISKENLEGFAKAAQQFGFDLLGEGGYYDTFVLDGPLFKARLELDFECFLENAYCGHVVVKSIRSIPKQVVVARTNS